MNNYTSSEKLPHLISLCINREYVTITEIIQYFDCTYKTASRLMDKAYDMQYELGFYYCDILNGKSDRIIKKTIRIKLDRKYDSR